MALTVEDDFREFVVARWPDLEGVALVVTRDPASARRVTTEALVDLQRRWRAALDDGRPGEQARRGVLRAAVTAATVVGGDRRATAGSAPAPDPTPGDDRGDPRPDDVVVSALADALRSSSPLERALVGARSLWACRPGEVAGLLGMPVEQARDGDAVVRARLLAAHTSTRAADGLAPAPWALEADLDAAVEHLLEGLGDPPDPAALVQERRRSLRRRSVLAGAAAVVGAGAVGWWSLTEDRTPSAAGSSARPTGRGVLPADDHPSWGSVSSWAPRGGLATDAGVQALVITRSSGAGRLLWADDVDGRRIVVAATMGPFGPVSAFAQVWQGDAGADPASLEEVRLGSPGVLDVPDVVAVAVPDGSGTRLVVLARPPVTGASVSKAVTPTVEGTIRRRWQPVPLRGGVGVYRWEDGAGPALRVRCGRLDGPPAAMAARSVGQAGASALSRYAEDTRRFVAAATGRPVDGVRTEVVVDAKVGGGILDARAFSPQGGEGRVVLLRTTTAGGAVVRSARVVDDGRSSYPWLEAEPPSVLPAHTTPDEPLVARLDDARPRVGRFLVVAPGATRVQLIATSPSAYPISTVTATREGVAIVEVINADDASSFRLVRRDAAGRRLGTGVPQPSVDLLDLEPEEQTLEG